MAADVVRQCRAKSDLKLGDHDPGETFGWDRQWAEQRAGQVLDEVADLQERLYAARQRSMLVVLQAMDAGGKDSTIRKVLSTVNVAGVHVTSFKVPTEDELAHDFLWRVHAHTPAKGMIGVFNRSHYEDVLVVRVKKLVPKSRWQDRYEHIRRFEQLLIAEGTSVVKLFLHISKDEQRKQLQERIDDPQKRWKFRRGDLAERELWADYQDAYADALRETSTKDAPWYVVPADHRWVRNLVVAEILHHHLQQIDPQFPEPEENLDGLVVK